MRLVYEGVHGYRDHRGTLLVVSAVTLRAAALPDRRDLGVGQAVGIDLSIRPYIVLGPLLFLVMLIPFTINGFAVREAFFVSFLGKLGVDADTRVRVRLPLLRDDARAGACRASLIICWEGVRRAPAVPDG